MKDNENILSDYIDCLNAERNPEKEIETGDTLELTKILKTVKLVRSLKEPAMPEPGYPQHLAKTIPKNIRTDDSSNVYSITEGKSKNTSSRHLHRKWVLPSAALVAGFIILALVLGRAGLFNNDIVYAMEKAINQVSSYHGVMEISSKNAAGEEWMVRKAEIWFDGSSKYAIRQTNGNLTVNNGERKWQVCPQNKEITLLPLVPDPTKDSFDLRDEANLARQYPHTVVGSEVIAGRHTEKLKISPPGGMVYYLWVDKETKLPIQLRTAMQNALQTTYTFVSFETNKKISSEIFTYDPPQGYKVIKKNAGQLVATLEEAAKISRFKPLLPDQAPTQIFAFNNSIVLDCGDTTIVETSANGPFELIANSALGTAAGGPLELWAERLRWRQNGIEIQIEGPQRVNLARQIAPDLTLPNVSESLAGQVQVKVPVDIKIIKAEQQQVDGGHGPWQLDPLQVSLTFVNLKVTPEGIIGEPKIGESCFKLIKNNGVESIVEVTEGPVKKVYLKRIIRQDETGIWTVIGYDPR